MPAITKQTPVIEKKVWTEEQLGGLKAEIDSFGGIHTNERLHDFLQRKGALSHKSTYDNWIIKVQGQENSEGTFVIEKDKYAEYMEAIFKIGRYKPLLQDNMFGEF